MNIRLFTIGQAAQWAAVLTCAMCLYAGQEAAPGSDRITRSFNTDWLFSPNGRIAGQSVSLDDSKFKKVCLPHSCKIAPHNHVDTASLAFVSWYRKHFSLPAKYSGRRCIIEFGAVSKTAEVFVNGQRVGGHKGAYTPFSFDITDFLTFGSDNLLAVKVDSRQKRDIAPEGKYVDYLIFGGIVRTVTLRLVNPFHLEWIYARVDTANSHCVKLEARVNNQTGEQRHGVVTVRIADSAGNTVARATAAIVVVAHGDRECAFVLGPLTACRFWHPDSPYLYTIYTCLSGGEGETDQLAMRFGIRTLSFSKSDGAFRINGRPLKLRGLNRHETFPFIGRAASDRLQAKDADIIKYDFGCNIVRCSHYPQSPAFLDRCDEIGLLVLEEMSGWVYVSTDTLWQATALENLKEMLLRDRNHPSIISFGVRINESADFHAFYTKTNRLARALDPSRPTHGVRVLGRGSKQEFLEDVWVYNYAVPAATPPVMPWITGEHVGHLATAHSWDEQQRLVDQMLAHAAVLDSAEANPKIAGLLGWCAFDYNSAYERYADASICYHGVADIFRLPKAAAWFYRSQADPAVYGPMVYIARDWVAGFKSNDVWVASNCDSVELFVNGKSRGRRGPDAFTHLKRPLFKWNKVSFKPGELTATGYIGGRGVATALRKTPGAAVRLAIVPDDTLLRTGGDMTRVVVSALDASGQPVPKASNIVSIAVEGNADFFGESPITLENGKTAFFIQTQSGEPGIVRLTSKSQNLEEAHANVGVQAAVSEKP